MAKRIVILGAGVAGAHALNSIHRQFHGDKNVSITVVDKNNHSTFLPMLHEVATGSVAPFDLTQPVRELVRCCLEHFHQAEVTGIDLEQRLITTTSGEIPYDYLIAGMGSTSNFFGVPGAEEYSLTLKSMQDALRLRRHLIDTFEEVSKLSKTSEHRADRLHFVIVGGGYTGVETAGQIADLFKNEFRKLYPEIFPDEPKITLVQGADRVLPILSESSSRKAHQRLEYLGVNIITSAIATVVTKEGVTLSTGEALQSHHVIWTSGVLARGVGLFPEEVLEKGRVKVKSTLQMYDHPEVFIIGDMAAVMEGGGPHPQTAQAAVQQAKMVGYNVRHLLHQEPLLSFHYKHKGDLVPIGNWWAVAEISGIKFSGFLAWWLRRTIYLQGVVSWPDRIRIMFNWTMNIFTKRDTTRL